MDSKQSDRARLEALITPPAQSINNYYPAEKPIASPATWLSWAIALPIACTLFLWGMQSGYSRAASDLAAARAETAAAQSKVAQIKACVEAIK